MYLIYQMHVSRTAANLFNYMCFWHHAIWEHMLQKCFKCSYCGHVTCVFDIMQFENICYKNVLNAVIAVARHYQREISNLLPIGHLPAQSKQLKH